MEMDTISALAEAITMLSEDELKELVNKVSKLEKILPKKEERVYKENYL